MLGSQKATAPAQSNLKGKSTATGAAHTIQWQASTAKVVTPGVTFATKTSAAPAPLTDCGHKIVVSGAIPGLEPLSRNELGGWGTQCWPLR